MNIERILSDLAKYWRVSLGSDAFIEKLTELIAKYPRVFDAVEERSFSQLSKFVPRPSTPISSEATRNWVAELNSRDAINKRQEEDRQAAEQREREQRAKHLAEAEKRKAEEAVAAAVHLNESRQFDLLIFDLDDTLIKSTHLDKYRGNENVGNRSTDYRKALINEATRLQHLIPESVLKQIKESFPAIRLGIFTRAPRVYAEVLLTHCYPNTGWDCVIAYDDVKRTKPYPDGILAAARTANIHDMRRIALVGDQSTDIIAAYQAGAFAILFRQGWGSYWNSPQNPARSDHYGALELVPDAIVDRPNELIPLITQPWKMLPALESWDAADGSEEYSPGTRVDERNHFNNLQPKSDGISWVKTKVMGRYFASHHISSRWDFRPKGDAHRLSISILAAKDGDEYPESWIACCARHIASLANDIRHSGRTLVVCPVPARPGRHGRIERLVERISGQLGIHVNITFENAILFFKDGVRSNKELDRDHRFMNVRDHLAVTENAAIAGNDILVIDDVVTSGATFYYADRYLRAAGAFNVHCLALAQTVS